MQGYEKCIKVSHILTWKDAQNAVSGEKTVYTKYLAQPHVGGKKLTLH
jgi:hypothetical protein